GQLVVDHAVLLVDLERESAAAGAEDSAGTGVKPGGRKAGRDHFLESRELDLKTPVVVSVVVFVVGQARRGGDEGEKAGRRHDGPDNSVHPFASFKRSLDCSALATSLLRHTLLSPTTRKALRRPTMRLATSETTEGAARFPATDDSYL